MTTAVGLACWRGLVAACAVVVALLASLGSPVAAWALVPVPALTGHVVDITATLQPQQKQEIEGLLAQHEQRTGSQVAVLLVSGTEGEAIEPFALRVAEAWKLGRARVDDGAILVVALQDRALRIEVGYGLEGVLTDAVSKRIIEEVILPRFRQGDTAGGVRAGVEKMLAVLDGQVLPPPTAPTDAQGGAGPAWLPWMVGILFVFGMAARAMLGRLRGAMLTGSVAGVAAWWLVGGLFVPLMAALAAAAFVLIGFLPRSGGGGGGWGGGRGGGGGGMSGGGGGFGGGGASGRW